MDDMTSEYESIKKTLERATELSAQPKTDFMELGRCLQELRAHPDGLKQFLSLSGMSRRKAYYLVSLAERALGWGVTEERLRELGWTKCEVLDSHFKKLEASGVDFDIEELLKLAEGCTAQQLKSELKTGTAQRKTHCVTMYLTPRQYRIFEDAVLSNGSCACCVVFTAPGSVGGGAVRDFRDHTLSA
ncbi:hypothetical protein [Aurantimonas sp. C2-4-R8]|uniref:hypothetical protein n=1 Tax=Aurantimonas sp. C2-4-R8 TaxID=3114364 RepID=UPI002E18ACA6